MIFDSQSKNAEQVAPVMFNPFKRKSHRPAEAHVMRDTLFCDAPLYAWPKDCAELVGVEPWKFFCAARVALANHRTSDAIAAWKHVIDLPGLESRMYAQAWRFLRQHGVQPPPEAATSLLGVVLEIPVGGAFDLIAAYQDRSARYWNYAGAGIVWERPNDSLDSCVDALLEVSQAALRAIGAGDNPRPAPPPPGHVRLSFICPGGLSYGQGPFEEFSKDPKAGVIIQIGSALMRKMMAVTSGHLHSEA